mmetsp:Transcript_80617/g.261275  ORF Transcript_80617/g.261275 Transcript_80617/m.261275 type:complete len:233 (+) Transcript_80617:1637-2335(+)
MPPRAMRWNFLPNARAIEQPMEVLPMPGGPCRQRMGPVVPPCSFRTAMNSSSRLFTRSRPWCSASSRARVLASSWRSSVETCHGRLAKVSRYLLATAYSGCDGCMAWRRCSSRVASRKASPGRPAAEICALSCETSSTSSVLSTASPRPMPGTSPVRASVGQHIPSPLLSWARFVSTSLCSRGKTSSKRHCTSMVSRMRCRSSSGRGRRAAPATSASSEVEAGHGGWFSAFG